MSPLVYRAPYNAFDSDPTTLWGNGPETVNYIGFDFGSSTPVRVLCVVLVQDTFDYVTEVDLIAWDTDFVTVFTAAGLGPGATRIQYTAADTWMVMPGTDAPTPNPAAGPTVTVTSPPVAPPTTKRPSGSPSSESIAENPTLTVSSTWTFDSHDAVDEYGDVVKHYSWSVYEMQFYSEPGCPDSSYLETIDNATTSSGAYDAHWEPYNAFDLDDSTAWGNNPVTGDYYWYVSNVNHCLPLSSFLPLSQKQSSLA
jgi:hypothetical protein